ncbi:MAG: pilus assembly protein CpaE [Pseudomonadota bacterium]|nr:pilus assembly protein CpaE [Pseudomonadota bacterium]
MTASSMLHDLDDDGFDAGDEFAGVADPFAPAKASVREAGPFMDDRDDSFALDVPAPAMPPPSNPVGALLAGAEAALGEHSVPRITIHAFCQRAETAKLVDYAANDRRLSRATIEVMPGGLAEALDRYTNQPTPALIIVESVEEASALLGGLDRLAEVCDAGTKVVLIGAHNDITLYRALMRRGVSEYLVPPMQPLQLIRAVTGLYADPATPFVGRTLAFVGAKGGCGSSTLAHNVAYQISEGAQANTVIVDYDLAFGTAGLDFNQDPLQGVADALLKPDRLDPTLLDRMTARCSERLSLFAAPASLDDDYDISMDAYEEVTSKIRSTAPYVVLDLPHLWSGWMRRLMVTVDDVVVTATPDLASLRNAKNLIDLVRKARPNDQPPQLILNQVGAPGRPEIPVKEFAKALQIEPALVLPFDPKLFGKAANNGQMIFEVNPKAKSSEGLALFAQQISRRETAAAPAAKSGSILDKLLKRG